MYRKNTINKSNLSKNLIKQLDDDDDYQDEFQANIKLNDSYKSLTQLKFDDSSRLYIDYYTCQEYNKKLLKKLNNLSRNNELLNHKIKEIKELKDTFDQETEKRSSIETKSLSSNTRNIQNDEKYFYEYILPKAKSTRKTGDDKKELLDKLFEADTAESIREVGNKLTANIDRIIADLDDSSIRVQNKHLFKRLDQLQRENDRYRYLFEILDAELN